MRRRWRALTLAPAIAILVSVTAAWGQDTAALLPGGASSLQESYGDWRVACIVRAAEKLCSLSQQHNQQNGQRIIAIEIIPAEEQASNGTLILPFGLNLPAGVTLAIDDEPVGGALSFSTCLPAGCIVPLTLDASIIDRLNAGGALKFGAVANGTAASLSFSISLQGFAAAMARTRELLL